MLAGKNLVITGVSSGIGRRTAELALAMRANVFGVDRVPPPAPMGHFVQGELGCQNGINEVVNQLPQKVDGLLAIAGLSGTGGAELTMKVNFYGLRYLAEQLAPKIREGGSITSVASFAGFGWRENLERTKSLLAIKGFPDAAELARLDCVNENSYPVSKEVWLSKMCFILPGDSN